MKFAFNPILIVVFLSTVILSSCNTNEVRLCFKADKQYPKIMERVSFSAACSENIDIYHWNFGDGIDTVTRGNTVEHTFAQEGVYTITLHNTNVAIVDHCPPGGSGVVASSTIEVIP
ncbi:MAG: PKD domain-containing protein [Bacteroidia bacterium]